MNTEDIQAEIRKDIRKVRESHEHYQKDKNNYLQVLGYVVSLYAICFNYDYWY